MSYLINRLLEQAFAVEAALARQGRAVSPKTGGSMGVRIDPAAASE